MCGIAGLFAKTPAARERLGADLAAMLGKLADRGPDSAGVAIYRSPVAHGAVKVSLLDPTGRARDWAALAGALGAAFAEASIVVEHGDQAVLEVVAEPDELRGWLAGSAPGLLVLGMGEAIEVYKRAGHPRTLIDEMGLAGMSGSHALGHTRMATESRVTTEHSHPFSTGLDLCLVHNGSLSNHNRLRRELRREGVSFATDNDSEVAAGYLSARLAAGASLDAALEACLEDLDGFFTFAVGTHDGFAVLRDPIACKPAVIGETADWVAMGSEFRAIAVLPGADDADLWEPEPGRVYSWTREAVAA